MKRITITLLCLSLNWLQACGKKPDETSQTKDVVGTTCYAKPVLRDTNGKNVCLWPDSNLPNLDKGEFFFAGLANSFNAKTQAIQRCAEANALDYGAETGRGKSCVAECKSIVTCVPFTNQ